MPASVRLATEMLVLLGDPYDPNKLLLKSAV